MTGAQIWLDCSKDVLQVDDPSQLVHISWRKNFTKFYTQFPPETENSQSSGRLANNELGDEMTSRVTDHGLLAQIGMNPARLDDQGHYMCEGVWLDKNNNLKVERKTFIVGVCK